MSNTKIGIQLALRETRDVDGLRFLILQLNRQVDQIEFELHRPDERDPLIRLLRAGKPIDRADLLDQLASFRVRSTEAVSSLTSQYGLRPIEPPQAWIVVSDASLADRWYTTYRNGVAIVALDAWERAMSPPSLAEFVLVQILGNAVRLRLRTDRPSSHVATRGCLFDFSAHLSDAKFKALNGHICSDCTKAMQRVGDGSLAKDLEKALNLAWLGSTDDSSSPASTAAKLGLNLFLSKNIGPSRPDRVKAFAATHLTEIAVAIVISALAVGLGIQ